MAPITHIAPEIEQSSNNARFIPKKLYKAPDIIDKISIFFKFLDNKIAVQPGKSSIPTTKIAPTASNALTTTKDKKLVRPTS